MSERTPDDGEPSNRAAELEQMFGCHLERDSTSGNWINVEFEHNGEIDHYYQNLNGL